MEREIVLRSLNRLRKLIIFWIVVAVIAAGLLLSAKLVPAFKDNLVATYVVVGVGIALLVASIIVIICFTASLVRLSRSLNTFDEENAPVVETEATQQEDEVVTTYVQTPQEKMHQIDQMEKTQFFIYMSRIFCVRGYEVELLPASDRSGIDFIATQGKDRIGVTCMLSKNLLNEEHVRLVANGMKIHKLKKAMLLTNAYFDVGAVRLARSCKIKLKDRDLMLEDFCCHFDR